MGPKENWDPKVNLEIPADLVQGVTLVPREKAENLDCKDLRVKMETMVELDCPELLVLLDLLVKWVSME